MSLITKTKNKPTLMNDGNKRFSVFKKKTENFILYENIGLEKIIIIPKKIVKKATKRNRIRRKIREAIRTSNLSINKTYVLRVKKNITNSKFKEIVKEVSNLI